MGKYLKAIVGFVAPGAVALVAAVQDGSPGSANVTSAEWVAAGCACVITAAAVWAVPNQEA